jgi:hypothetical protein
MDNENLINSNTDESSTDEFAEVIIIIYLRMLIYYKLFNTIFQVVIYR